MTLEQEFQKQWEGLCNYVKSEILKLNPGTVDLNRLQSIVESEKKKWFLPGQYNNAWFEKLKRANPEAALKFEECLNQIKVEPIAIKQSNSTLVVLGLAIAGVAIGFYVSRILMSTLLPSVLLSAGGGALGLSIGRAISSKNKNDKHDEFCMTYIEQLKKAGEVLSQIVSQAD